MTPTLSIVIPTFNEQDCILDCIRRWCDCLDARGWPFEIVVADDGSEDRTAAAVEAYAAGDARIRLIRGAHQGKGAAVRRGMLDARGTWRFLADADLAMPPDNISRFFAVIGNGRGPHLAIGSREAPGSRRIGEPWLRHVVGRLFNHLVQIAAVPGIRDTQCGFKLVSAEAAEALFPLGRVNGFAFDVELLFLARTAGFEVREVGIEWHARPGSRVSLLRGAAAFADVLHVRWHAWRGRYRDLPSCAKLVAS